MPLANSTAGMPRLQIGKWTTPKVSGTSDTKTVTALMYTRKLIASPIPAGL